MAVTVSNWLKRRSSCGLNLRSQQNGPQLPSSGFIGEEMIHPRDHSNAQYVYAANSTFSRCIVVMHFMHVYTAKCTLVVFQLLHLVGSELKLFYHHFSACTQFIGTCNSASIDSAKSIMVRGPQMQQCRFLLSKPLRDWDKSSFAILLPACIKETQNL